MHEYVLIVEIRELLVNCRSRAELWRCDRTIKDREIALTHKGDRCLGVYGS